MLMQSSKTGFSKKKSHMQIRQKAIKISSLYLLSTITFAVCMEKTRNLRWGTIKIVYPTCDSCRPRVRSVSFDWASENSWTTSSWLFRYSSEVLLYHLHRNNNFSSRKPERKSKRILSLLMKRFIRCQSLELRLKWQARWKFFFSVDSLSFAV